MTEVVGGGVVLAVAAALWLVYLMPTWMSRRQYTSTERNAVRLQQTLRILAETSEVPREVRLEATARNVAAQQRVLRGAQERSRLEEKAAEALRRAEQLNAEAAAADAATAARAAEQRVRAAAERAALAARAAARAGADTRRRVRRARALSSLVLLASFSGAAVGGAQLAVGASALLLILGAVGTVAALLTLSALARTERSTRESISGVVDASVSVSKSGQSFVPVEWAESKPAPVSGWTPQPLPRPLYMQRGSAAAHTLDTAAAAAGLREASAEAERARRAAALSPKVTPISRPRPLIGAPIAAAIANTEPNRFASMGVIGEAAPGQTTDLDAVLRRRRATA